VGFLNYCHAGERHGKENHEKLASTGFSPNAVSQQGWEAMMKELGAVMATMICKRKGYTWTKKVPSLPSALIFTLMKH